MNPTISEYEEKREKLLKRIENRRDKDTSLDAIELALLNARIAVEKKRLQKWEDSRKVRFSDQIKVQYFSVATNLLAEDVVILQLNQKPGQVKRYDPTLVEKAKEACDRTSVAKNDPKTKMLNRFADQMFQRRVKELPKKTKRILKKRK